MNTFKKITRATAIPGTINTAKSNAINIDSICEFPALNNITKIENETNFNFIDATKKKVVVNTEPYDTGLCTIYYDKELKKIVTHNFPQKMYRDDDDDRNIDNNSETNSTFFIAESETIPNIYNIKNPLLHYGMNKTIRGIMERRDKFIDQYGVDEYIRDYLPKDSPYLYSRYYYKNKYLNNHNHNHKNKFNNKNNNVTIGENNVIDVIDSPIENDLILYDDIDVVDADIELDDDIDEDDD